MFALSPEYAHLPDGLKFAYAMVALLSEGKYDVIISAAIRGTEMENLRPLREEMPAVWPDILNAMHLVSVRRSTGVGTVQLQPTTQTEARLDDDHRLIVAMSNDLWFRGMEVKEEGERRKNSMESRAHLEAMVLRTKPEANQWLHLTPRVAALVADAFERGPVMIRKIYA